MKISYEELKEIIKQVLIKNGVDSNDADIMATVHADSTLKGVNSHGVNRIPRLVDFIKDGLINTKGVMTLVNKFGNVENYDGQMGFGVINALKACDRVTEIAKEFGIGLLSLKNTSHWMRAGTYTEKIADKGMIGLIWTNTESIMPLWGSDQINLGNNPISISIPSESGNVVLDMALSQYSYGKLETVKLSGEKLPFVGGYNKYGKLTDNPSEIEETQRLLPIGYWKGSALAICLDMMASILANGRSTYDMDKENGWNCTGCSQIFIAINPLVFSTKEEIEEKISMIKKQIKEAHKINANVSIRYPGQGSKMRKEKNLKNGIEIDDEIYKKIISLSK
ncbi:MAG: 3-dehydro-L-gulonate 2-dehydrogenase [Peptoniphilaceae bacterium]|nr:3-dehydro-L-gulonate 2-dehydrogenase [Peptoniphilaceae bacterium]